MTAHIVDGLEPVEVHDEQRQRRSVPLVALDFIGGPRLEEAPIEKTGERIGGGEAMQVIRPATDEVPEDGEGAHRRPHDVGVRRGQPGDVLDKPRGRREDGLRDCVGESQTHRGSEAEQHADHAIGALARRVPPPAAHPLRRLAGSPPEVVDDVSHAQSPSPMMSVRAVQAPPLSACDRIDRRTIVTGTACPEQPPLVVKRLSFTQLEPHVAPHQPEVHAPIRCPRVRTRSDRKRVHCEGDAVPGSSSVSFHRLLL